MARPSLACERARSRTFYIGLALHALEWGAAGSPGLCLLHGGAAHAHWWDAVATAFADRFHVVALDQRGHGESAWPVPPAYGTRDFAEDLAAVADALGWPRFSVVGHSMGGHNAMAFAAWYPGRVQALVIADARPAIAHDRLRRLRARGQRAPRLHASEEAAVASFRLLPPDTIADAELLAHLARVGIARGDGGFTYRFDPAANGAREPIDAWPLLGGITAPTLIVRGEHSPILARDVAERMQRTIPSATLVEIARAYHHLVLDRPDAFVAAVTPFLAGAGG